MPAPESDSTLTRSERVARELARDIIAGTLAPGEKLEELVLAARFGVSRTPVREALRQLQATGLVSFQARRGFTVAAIDTKGLLDLFEAASEIEGLCAKLSALRGGLAERKQIEIVHRRAAQAVAERRGKQYAELNEVFHRAIYAAARNQTLTDIALHLRQRLAPFRAQVFFDAGDRLATSVAEHDRITRAIGAGDGDAAFAAMRDHTASSAANVINYFEPAPAAVNGARAAPRRKTAKPAPGRPRAPVARR